MLSAEDWADVDEKGVGLLGYVYLTRRGLDGGAHIGFFFFFCGFFFFGVELRAGRPSGEYQAHCQWQSGVD
jgi:hypothetical protein